MHKSLCVVMPVYNEEACIENVTRSWNQMLKNTVGNDFLFLILDDGSTDSTPKIIDNLKTEFPEIEVIHKKNTGHGQTCIFGYQKAIAENFEWIFQIDSDGQCDPQYFPKFWSARGSFDAIFGHRVKRDDGFFRAMISKFVTIFTLIATWRFVKDANVPYRLMRTKCLSEMIKFIPSDFHLANIAVAVLLQKKFSVNWIPIHFLQRLGSQPSVKAFSFLKHGFKLFSQLRQMES